MTVSTQPDLVLISILGSTTQLDSGLPAHLPIAALMPDLLAALHVPDDSDAPTWTLARIDGARLPPAQTLAQAGVLDGDLLVLRADRPGSRSPLVDDVADGIATALRRDREGWTAESSRWIGYAVLLVSMIASAPAGRAAAAADRTAVLAVAGAVAATLLVIALAGRRLQVDPRTASIAALSACAPAGLAASLLVPAAGAAQATLAAIAVGTVAVLGSRTGRFLSAHVAVATIAALSVFAGVVAVLWGRPVADLAAVTAVLAVGVALLAPRLAIALGRLPLPAVPTIAPDPMHDDEPAAVDGVDALRLSDRDPLGAIAELALGDMAALAARAASTAQILSGILVGAVLTAGTAIVILAATAGGSRIVLAYCLCTAAALAARGRTHADRTQSTILIAGAGATTIGGALALLITGVGPGAFALFAAILGLGIGALLLGTVTAGGDYSPPAVRAAEIVEYTVLLALFPLLLWVLDAYRAIRQL